MRKVNFLVTLIMLCFVSIGMINAESPNLLVNTGFETGKLEPWGTYKASGSPTFSVTTQEAHSGSYSAYLSTSTSTDRGSLNLISNFGLVPNQKYKVRVWAKTRGPANKEIAYLRVAGLNKEKAHYLPEEAPIFQRIVGNTEWNLYEYEFAFKPPAAYVKVEFFISQGSSDGTTKGELWVDDVELVMCSDNTDVGNVISFLPNVGYEIDQNGDLLPDGWRSTITQGGRAFLVPKDNGPGKALLLDNGNDTEGQLQMQPQSVALPGNLPAGTRLNISGYYKAENVQRAATDFTSVTLSIKFIDAVGNSQYLSYNFEEGTYDWQYFSVTTYFSVDVQRIEYAFLQLYRASGKLWLDDIGFFIDLPPQTTSLQINCKEEVELGESIPATIEALKADGTRDPTKNGIVMVSGAGSNPVPVYLVVGEGKLEPSQIETEEVILYDDFETSYNSWVQTKREGILELVSDNQITHSGSTSAKISSLAYSRGWYFKTIEIEGGKYYYLSIWAKAENLRLARPRAKLFKGSEQLIIDHPFGNQFGDINYPSLIGTQDWTRLGGWVYAPPGTTSILIDLYFEGAGTVWFDDFCLEAVKMASIPYQGVGGILLEAWDPEKLELRATKPIRIVYGKAASLSLASHKLADLVGSSAEVTVEVRNSFNYPIAQLPTSLQLESGPLGSKLEVSNTSTDTMGKVQGALYLGDEAGTCRIIASVPSASDVGEKRIEVKVVDELLFLIPDKNTVLPNESLGLIVRLESKSGEPLADRVVKLLISPEATLPTSVITDENGEAHVEVSFGTLAGLYEITAIENDYGYQETINLRCIPGPVTRIEVAFTPSTVAKSNHLSTIVQGTLFDEFDNSVLDGEKMELWHEKTKLGEGETANGIAQLQIFLPEGQQTVQIKAGDCTSSRQVEIKIPQLTLPKENGAVIISNVNLQWENIPGATEYLIDCAADPDFTNLLVDSKKSKEYKMPIIIREEGVIYWRVRATTENGLVTSKIGKFEVVDPGTGLIVAVDGFEGNFESWELTQAEGNLNLLQDSLIKYEGNSSAQLSSSQPARGWTSKRFEIVEGKKYFVSAWCRTETVASASIRAKLYNANGIQVPITGNPFCNNPWGDLNFPGVAGTNDWKKLAGWFIAPAGTKTVGVELMLTGPGHVWWDLVEIMEVPEDFDPSVIKDLYYVGVAPTTINAANPYIRYNLLFAKDAEVSVVIFDVAGRVVRNLVHNLPVIQATSAVSAPNTVEWDGKGDNGREVANGLYISRIEVKIPGKRSSVIMKKVYVMR